MHLRVPLLFYMYRLTRIATQSLRTPLFHHAFKRTVPVTTSFTFKSHFSNTPVFFKNKQEDEEDDLEVIDPKEFPELYPEEGEEEVDTEWFVDEDESQLSERDFIPLWQRRAVGDHLEDRLALKQVSKELMESGKVTAETVSSLLEESKMDNVTVIDVREKCDWTQYMIVASSEKGDKYISSVADHIGSVVSSKLLVEEKSLMQSVL